MFLVIIGDSRIEVSKELGHTRFIVLPTIVCAFGLAMELVEVYRVTYKGPIDKLRGIIVCKDEVNGYQYLFKDDDMVDEDISSTMLKYHTFEGYKDVDKQLDLTSKPVLTSLDHILPNAHIESSIRAKDGFSISLYLFGVVHKTSTLKYPHFRPDKLSIPRFKYIRSEDGSRHLMVFYAIFGNAVEAHVKVTLTNISNQFKLYGVVAARTSAIEDPAYSSIIFCKSPGEKIQMGNGDDIIIPLSRDIIAVPLGHKLILQFGLNGCDNDEMVEEDSDKIVEKIVKFEARKEGTSTYDVSCSKGVLKVEVSWRST